MRRNLKWIILPVVLVGILVAGYVLFGEELLERNPTPDPPDPEDMYFKDAGAFNAFLNNMRDLTGSMAAEDEYQYGYDGYAEYTLPESLDGSSEDPAVRYLTGKLEQSRSLGYDFSELFGQEVVMKLYVYTRLGATPRIYFGIAYPDGSVAGIWSDDYQASSDEVPHWTDLELGDRIWTHENVTANPHPISPVLTSP